jgi:hypothetical protein
MRDDSRQRHWRFAVASPNHERRKNVDSDWNIVLYPPSLLRVWRHTLHDGLRSNVCDYADSKRLSAHAWAVGGTPKDPCLDDPLSRDMMKSLNVCSM